MKTSLVPTDFSTTAQAAVDVAVNIAEVAGDNTDTGSAPMNITSVNIEKHVAA